MLEKPKLYCTTICHRMKLDITPGTSLLEPIQWPLFIRSARKDLIIVCVPQNNIIHGSSIQKVVLQWMYQYLGMEGVSKISD